MGEIPHIYATYLNMIETISNSSADAKVKVVLSIAS